MNTYQLLKEFGRELEENGVNNVPLQFKPQDLNPFYEIFAKYDDRIKNSLVEDLRFVFGDNLSFTFELSNVHFHDINAQGSTYVIYLVRMENASNRVSLSLRLVVFHDRIIVRIINQNQNIFDDSLSKDSRILNLKANDVGIDMDRLDHH